MAIFIIEITFFYHCYVGIRECEDLRDAGNQSGLYAIDPDGPGGLPPFQVGPELQLKHTHRHTLTHTHTHTQTHTHTHTHTHRDIQGFRGGALGGCVLFIRGESYNHDFYSSGS